MKKWIVCLIVFVLAFSLRTASGFADSHNEGKFNAKITSGMDYTTAKWMSSKTNRAGLTVMLYLDFLLGTDYEASSSFLVTPSYVLQSGTNIVAIIPHEDGYVLIDFSTQNPEETEYIFDEDASQQAVKIALKTIDGDCYENDMDSLYDIVEIFQEVLSE